MNTINSPSSLPCPCPICRWVILLALLGGCSYPAAEPENMRLISSLRTALSARNETWLAKNEAMINQRHAAGKMRNEVHQAFCKIIEQARAGDWRKAEEATLAFQRSQRPTDEQIQRLRRRTGGA